MARRVIFGLLLTVVAFAIAGRPLAWMRGD